MGADDRHRRPDRRGSVVERRLAERGPLWATAAHAVSHATPRHGPPQRQPVRNGAEALAACDPAQHRDRWRAVRPGWTEAGWWDADLSPQVRALLWLPKGPELMTAVTRLGTPSGRCPFPHPFDAQFGGPLGTPGNPCACQLVTLAAWAVAAAWATEQSDTRVLQALSPSVRKVPLSDDLPGLGSLTDPGVEQVAAALRRSPASLRNHLAKLRSRSRAPDSLREAIRSGLMPAWQADLLLTDVDDLDPADRDHVLDTTVGRYWTRHSRGLRGWTFSEVRAYAKRVRSRVPRQLERERAEAGRRRGIQVRDHGRSRATLSADLPSDVAHRIFNRITAMAGGMAPADSRTLDQRRADVFTDLLLGPTDHGDAGSSGQGEVAVIINLTTLLGADNDPADLTGCGPIPAGVARTLAGDAKWRAWLTDATGTVVATSPRTYTPTAAVARMVRAREPQCRMPGCRSRRVDLDHVTPWPGGSTTSDNLGSLCRRHHNLKTHGDWDLINTHDPGPPGYTWTDPAGVKHTDCHPPPLGAE